MNELTYIENVTKQKCVTCGDKLTDWENTYCVMCEPDTFEEFESEEW